MTLFYSNRRALFFSVIALIICIIMLLGSTYAWFTDSATSPDNNIQTGTLDIVLEYWDGDSWEDAESNVIPFVAADGRAQSEILWEPGCTYNMAPFRVRNEGSLCAKILITINGISGDAKLLEVIDFKTNINNIPESVLNGSAGNQLQQFEDATVNIMTGMPEGDIVFDWSLAGKNTTTPGTGHTDTSPEFTISAHMAEEAGNEYMNLTLEGISITVLATQQTYESDAFSNSYDKNATFPVVGNVVKAENEVKTVSIGNIRIDIPASAPVGSYEMAVSNKNETTDADGNTTLTMDIVLKKDGAKVAADGTTIYTVAIEIGANKTVTAITHNAVAITEYSYDSATGIVTFDTDSFSPFTVTYANKPALDMSTVSAVLKENDWETIQAVIKAGKIEEAGWKVGDVSPDFTINGETRNAILIGVDQDGENTATFMIVERVGVSKMRELWTNEGGYGETIVSDMLDKMESTVSIADYMVSVNKSYYYDVFSEENYKVGVDSGKLFLLSLEEVGMMDEAIVRGYRYLDVLDQESSFVYKYFQTDDAKKRGDFYWETKHNQGNFWLRSSEPDSTVGFFAFDREGDFGGGSANTTNDILPAFVIG